MAGSSFADGFSMMEQNGYFDVPFVQRLLGESGESLNLARAEDGVTVVHLAAQKNHQARLLALLLNGAEVNAKDHEGRTPLFYNLAYKASGKDDSDRAWMILEMLIFCGANLNEVDKAGKTPLGMAVEGGDYAKAEFLLWAGAEGEPKNREAKSPWQIALGKGDARMIELLRPTVAPRAGWERFAGKTVPEALNAADLNAIQVLLQSGWQINEQDANGRTALYRAVESARADLVNLLIMEGANPNLATKTGQTPLMLSMKNLTNEGQRINAMLLLKGADILAKNKGGATPLAMAAEAGNDYGLLWLISAGADLTAETPKGSLINYAEHPPTVRLLGAFGLTKEVESEPTEPVDRLIAATKKNEPTVVNEILASGFPPDTTDKTNRTAMAWAVSWGRYEVIDLLLKYGANINRQMPKTGNHALHLLAGWGTPAGGGNAEVAAAHIKYIVARGADVNVARHDGTTPLMVAAKEGATGANTEALLKAGARLDLRDKAGLTALGVARKSGRTEMVEFLLRRGAME